MPTDACQIVYDCKGCGERLKPLPGDCCVLFVRLLPTPVQAAAGNALLVRFRVAPNAATQSPTFHRSRRQQTGTETSLPSQTPDAKRLDDMAILDHCARHVRPKPHLRQFAGRLFASGKRWLRPSFLLIEIMDTPGQQADGA